MSKELLPPPLPLDDETRRRCALSRFVTAATFAAALGAATLVGQPLEDAALARLSRAEHIGGMDDTTQPRGQTLLDPIDCRDAGALPPAHLVLVEPELAAAVVRDPGGSLRLLRGGEPLVPSNGESPADSPLCVVERFLPNALECLEAGPAPRRLRVHQSERGQASRITVLARCAPGLAPEPSTVGDLPPP
ncbi:MAG TPA: hypothetical protein VNB06_14030 [Thermoanaerobaculia bacterium]|nr:hypothetical protein [Thermoanaerobaculia bacterium]